MEYQYGYMQTNAMGKMNPTQPESEEVMAKGNPDVVYVFSDKSKPGVMFYCPTGAAEKAGKVYTTRVDGIQTGVQWIEGTNVENQSVRIPTYGGMPYTATTHMVSEEKLAEIKAKIEEARGKEEETLTIDVNDRKKEFFWGMSHHFIGAWQYPTTRIVRIPGSDELMLEIGSGDIYNQPFETMDDDNDLGEL